MLAAGCSALMSASCSVLPLGFSSAPARSYFEMSLTFIQASAQTKINLTEWHINIITFDSMENLLTIALSQG